MHMRRFHWRRSVFALLRAAAVVSVRHDAGAQRGSDGASAVLNGTTTNLAPGNFIVGTNGNNTSLLLTNGAVVTSGSVFLGTFVDDPADWLHVDTVKALCADVMARPLDPVTGRIRSLAGLVTGQALTLPYFHASALRRWVDATLEREQIRKCFVFSSAMAQYVTGRAALRRVVDLVDVDSEKWRQYGTERRWPLTWIYRREADRLLAFETATTREFDASLLRSRGWAPAFTLEQGLRETYEFIRETRAAKA